MKCIYKNVNNVVGSYPEAHIHPSIYHPNHEQVLEDDDKTKMATFVGVTGRQCWRSEKQGNRRRATFWRVSDESDHHHLSCYHHLHHLHHHHHHHQHHHRHHHQDHYHHNNCDNNTIVLLTGLTLTKCMITRIVCLQLTTGHWVYFTGLTLTKTMITRGVCLQTHYVAKLHSCKMMAEIKQVSCKTNVSGAQALMMTMINRSSPAIWKVCLLTYYLAKLVSPQQCSVQQWWRRLNKFRTKQMCLECEVRLD